MFFFRRDPALDGVGITVTSAALNLADGGPPDDARAFAEAVGVPVVGVHQVHGRRVVAVDSAADGFAVLDEEADGLLTSTRGIGLAVRTADCVPVLLADPDAGVIAAVHAGRAGVLNGIVDEALDQMRSRGARAVKAWIGPHICGACYEVAPEMAADYARSMGLPPSHTRWGTPSIDLAAGLRGKLDGTDVETIAGCTLSEPHLHSYRRDGAAAGRLISTIWLA